MAEPAPGWYPNPDGTESARYWDGTRWTQQVRPWPIQPPQPPQSPQEPELPAAAAPASATTDERGEAPHETLIFAEPPGDPGQLSELVARDEQTVVFGDRPEPDGPESAVEAAPSGTPEPAGATTPEESGEPPHETLVFPEPQGDAMRPSEPAERDEPTVVFGQAPGPDEPESAAEPVPPSLQVPAEASQATEALGAPTETSESGEFPLVQDATPGLSTAASDESGSRPATDETSEAPAATSELPGSRLGPEVMTAGQAEAAGLAVGLEPTAEKPAYPQGSELSRALATAGEDEPPASSSGTPRAPTSETPGEPAPAPASEPESGAGLDLPPAPPVAPEDLGATPEPQLPAAGRQPWSVPPPPAGSPPGAPPGVPPMPPAPPTGFGPPPPDGPAPVPPSPSVPPPSPSYPGGPAPAPPYPAGAAAPGGWQQQPGPGPYPSSAYPYPSADPYATGGAKSPENTGIAALVLGILAFPMMLLCFVLAIPTGIAAVIVGIIGVTQAGRTVPPRPKGKAIAGIALGSAALLLSLMLVLLLIPYLSQA